MRIAVVHNLPSGGALRSLASVAAHLARSHELTFFVPGSAEREFLGSERHAVAVHALPWQPRPRPGSALGRLLLGPWLNYTDYWSLLRVYTRLAELIASQRQEVVLLNPCSVFYTPPLVRRLGVPSLFLMQEVYRYVHEPQIERPYARSLKQALIRVGYESYTRPLLRWLDRRQVRAVSSVVANSNYAARRIADAYAVEPVVVHPTVDRARFRPLELPRGEHVLSVGALHPSKGYDFLVRSLATIPAGRRPLLEIIFDRAEPGEQAFLEALASELGVQLRLRHRVGEEALVEAYNRAALFVYAPVREPLGYGPLEAQACGLAVVGVAEGGVCETVLDGETGLLRPRDEESFASAVDQLLSSPQRRLELGRAGIAHIQEQWSRPFGEQIEQQLSGLLEAAGQGRSPGSDQS